MFDQDLKAILGSRDILADRARGITGSIRVSWAAV